MAGILKAYEWPDGDTGQVIFAHILDDATVRFGIKTLSDTVHGTTISAGQLRALEHDATNVERRGPLTPAAPV